MSNTELPLIIIYATSSGGPLSDLFSRRGFVVGLIGGFADLDAYLANGGSVPAAAVIDLEAPDGDRAVPIVAAMEPRPALVGISGQSGGIAHEELMDSAFRRPVDPARLFTRVVTLLAERKKGAGVRKKRLTGIVAVVKGNELFHVVEKELWSAVPPVNAGAILEKALGELGSSPSAINPADLAAMLASGRLAEALRPFGEPVAITQALEKLATRL